jgi:nitrite reductase/ring-hydroxylating ferredoxin subunit
MTEPRASRRIVFHGLSALGVAAALAGCGGGEDSTPTATDPTPRESSSPTEGSSPRDSPPGSASPSTASPSTAEPSGAGAEVLAATDEIPVGGGIVLAGRRIVITQPSAGRYEAFSAVCKHQGETVGSVQDNVITCPFHGSQYDAASGAVTRGPATSGLDPVRIRVRDGRIVRG